MAEQKNIGKAEYIEGSRMEWKEGIEPRAYNYGVWWVRADSGDTGLFPTNVEIEPYVPDGFGIRPDSNVAGYITEVSNASGAVAIMGSCYIHTLQVMPKFNAVRFRFTLNYYTGEIFVRPMIVV